MLYSHRQRLFGDAAARAESVLSGQDSLSAAAHRYQLQVPGDDRVSRRYCARTWRQADRAYEQGGARGGANPFRLGTTRVLRAAEDQSAARCAGGRQISMPPFGGARRDEEKSRAKERIYSFRDTLGSGIRRTSGRNCGTSTTAGSTRARASGSFRSRTGPNWTCGNTSIARTFRSCRCISRKTREVVVRGDSLIPLEHGTAAARRKAADGDVPHAIAGLQPLHRRDPFAKRTRCRNHRRADASSAARSARTA